MAENGEVWLVRSHPDSIEIPVAPAEVAKLYESIGWEALPLRKETLSQTDRHALQRALDAVARSHHR